MGKYLLALDAIRGAAGGIWWEVDGVLREIAHAQDLQISATMNQTDFPVIGALSAQVKTYGTTMSGSFTLHSGDPTPLRMLYDQTKNGMASYFKLTVKVADPSSTQGRQTITLTDCQLSSMDLVNLDANSAFITQNIAFVFSQFEILDEFNEPIRFGSNDVEGW